MQAKGSSTPDAAPRRNAPRRTAFNDSHFNAVPLLIIRIS